MKLTKALEVVRFHRRQMGRNKVHCAEPMCSVCALLAVHDELQFQWTKDRSGAAPKHPRPSSSRGFCRCGEQLIDGICGNCNG